MRKAKNFALILFLAAALFSLTGCSLSFNTGASSGEVDGGVFKSTDKGASWTQSTIITNFNGRTLDIRNLDVNILVMDPSDNQTLYLGSLSNGLYYTYDAGASWQVNSRLGKTLVNSLAVDPASKCVIYMAVANRLYKSEDCGRDWNQSYFDNDPAVFVRSTAIDPKNSAIVFITTSRGEVIKSIDGGKTWRTVGRLEDDILKIVISPHNSDIMFAGTAEKGLYRSMDGGENWTSQEEALKAFSDRDRFRDLVFSVSDPGTVFFASHYGLLKSTDNGGYWTALNLITPKEEAVINSAAVSPVRADEIYYATDTTYYHSTDGGKNWSSKKLPTSRAARKLIIDPKNPAVIYLGVGKK